jgi:hypothetical protein
VGLDLVLLFLSIEVSILRSYFPYIDHYGRFLHADLKPTLLLLGLGAVVVTKTESRGQRKDDGRSIK